MSAGAGAAPDDDLGYDVLEEVRLQEGEQAIVVPAGMDYLIIPHDTISVAQPRTWQGVIVFTGRAAHMFGDDAGEFAPGRHAFTMVERAVTVARLRAVCDIIENPEP